METQLVVVRPFGGLARGAVVTDPVRIDEILAGEHALNVVRVLAAAAGAAQAAAAKQGAR